MAFRVKYYGTCNFIKLSIRHRFLIACIARSIKLISQNYKTLKTKRKHKISEKCI